MSFNVRTLRKLHEVRNWSKIIEENPYVAVVQVTGGRAWGRTNMKSRILGKHYGSEHVGARYAVPKVAREGIKRTRFVGLSDLFRGSPSAVIYGSQVDPVVETIKRATDIIDGGILIGGRFGENIVTAKTWQKVLESDGELEEWKKFVTILSKPPPILQLLDQQSKGMIDVVQKAGGQQDLVHVLNKIQENKKQQ